MNGHSLPLEAEETIAVECHCLVYRCEVWEFVVALLVQAEDRCVAGEELVADKQSLLLVASSDFSAAVLIVSVLLIAYYLVGCLAQQFAAALIGEIVFPDRQEGSFAAPSLLEGVQIVRFECY